MPWTLKPLLIFLAEQLLSPKGRGWLLALAASVTGLAWVWLASGGGLLLATGLVSLGSALVDGLTDGRIAAESDEQSGVRLQALCQAGHGLGALAVPRQGAR